MSRSSRSLCDDSRRTSAPSSSSTKGSSEPLFSPAISAQLSDGCFVVRDGRDFREGAFLLTPDDCLDERVAKAIVIMQNHTIGCRRCAIHSEGRDCHRREALIEVNARARDLALKSRSYTQLHNPPWTCIRRLHSRCNLDRYCSFIYHNVSIQSPTCKKPHFSRMLMPVPLHTALLPQCPFLILLFFSMPYSFGLMGIRLFDFELLICTTIHSH